MQFETAWYILNLIGFRKLDWAWEFGPKSRRHQDRIAKENIDKLFSDDHVFKPPPDWEGPAHHRNVVSWGSYHEPTKPLRDKSIPIKGPKRCVRCKSRKNLEREHIIALKDGGEDVSSNLQWMCQKCHDLKHSEEKILDELEHMSPENWRYEMWQYRLEALRRLNPIGAPIFHSYGEDPKTLWDHWANLEKKKHEAERTKQVKRQDDVNTIKLEAFI